MGLFKSKESKEQEVIDKLTKPYIDNGFVISKKLLIQNASLFMVDTENKKWAYTNLAKEKQGIVKIHDFNELNKYDAIKNANEGNFKQTIRWTPGVATTSSNKRYVYNIKAYINSKDIDESVIDIMNISFDSDSIMALSYNKFEELYNEIVKCLEYILNNKE